MTVLDDGFSMVTTALVTTVLTALVSFGVAASLSPLLV